MDAPSGARLKTPAEFDVFYQMHLLPQLQPLEDERQKMARRTYMAVGIGLAIAVVAFFCLQNDASGLLIPALMGVLFITGAGIFLLQRSGSFTQTFKQEVIQGILHFLVESMRYEPEASVSEAEFRFSDIFRDTIDRYTGDDLVSGRLGTTELKFSEVHADYKTETRDSKGNTRTEWHTIFKGLFFIADFNKPFTGKTVVLPDNAERFLGAFGQSLQSLAVGRGELVRLESPEFEKLFCVYSSDQVEARYLLSTTFMECLVALRQKIPVPIYISFLGSKIYIALPMARKLFEPPLFSTLLSADLYRGYFHDFCLPLGLVDDLHLNDRLFKGKNGEVP